MPTIGESASRVGERRASPSSAICTSPASHFTRNTVCSRATPQGRITLSGSRLIETDGRGRRERFLTEAERTKVLRDAFGIDV